MASETIGEGKNSFNKMMDAVLNASQTKHRRNEDKPTIQYGTAGFRTK